MDGRLICKVKLQDRAREKVSLKLYGLQSENRKMYQRFSEG